MTDFKLSAKKHLFIIISTLFIVIGLAVGTICHFCANGFFNYGGEFAPYKSIVVTYYASEYRNEEAVRPICDDALKGLNAYEVSYAETTFGGEAVYKFTVSTDSEKLEEAATALTATLDKTGSGLNVASLHEGVIEEGGSRALIYASIAVASAAAFQLLYFVFRYKLRAGISALLACVHNLGVFVALAAITRLPVGTEFIALSAAVVLLTMILSCVFFDRTRKNFKDEKYAKTDRSEVVDVSAKETRTLTVSVIIGAAAVVVLLAIFAIIPAQSIAVLAPYALALLGVVSCFYGATFFTPSVHSGIDALCEKIGNSREKDAKKEKSAKASS